MPTRQTNRVLAHLHRIALRHECDGMSDALLLEHFLTRREEAAFAALVRRHGPMVLGVCRRVLDDPHDADDAFQATFLVLVRKAASVRPRERVGPWLYGVARRTALKVRAARARRRHVEQEAARARTPASQPESPWNDLRALLDEELSRLPERYRDALVLCLLEGKSRKEAAGLLGWSEGTLSGRLARAKNLLAGRLTKRGVTLSAGALGVALAESTVTAAVPAALAAATARAALAAGASTAAEIVSAPVIALTEEVVRSMLMVKLKTVAGVVLLVAGVGAGTCTIGWRHGVAAQGAAPAEEEAGARRAPAAEKKEAEPSPYVIEPPDVLRVEYAGKLAAGGPKITGQHLVRPDGTIGLGALGAVTVNGLTVEDARGALDRELSRRLDDFESDKLRVEVAAFNSKVCYVILDAGAKGERVVRIPCTGDVTVLDVLGGVKGSLVGVGKKRIYIERGPRQKLPVDWSAITQDGATATNYQLFSGDRVYVVAAKDSSPAAARDAGGSDVLHVRQRQFQIPIQIDSQRRAQVDRLTLWVSTDFGNTYSQSEVAEPTKKGFTFHAKNDGVYWFIVQVQSDGKRDPTDLAAAKPNLKIRVDTKGPAVVLEGCRPYPRLKVTVWWKVSGENLDLSTFRLQWRIVNSQQWHELDADNSATGELSWSPPADNSRVEIRATVRDRAGNEGASVIEIP